MPDLPVDATTVAVGEAPSLAMAMTYVAMAGTIALAISNAASAGSSGRVRANTGADWRLVPSKGCDWQDDFAARNRLSGGVISPFFRLPRR
jgi:hypothetical protein